jgi:hypothetical protein
MSFKLKQQLKLWVSCASIVLLGIAVALMLVAVQVNSTAGFWIGLGLTSFTLYGIIRLVPQTIGRK